MPSKAGLDIGSRTLYREHCFLGHRYPVMALPEWQGINIEVGLVITNKLKGIIGSRGEWICIKRS